MRKKISLMLPLLCALLAFWACGDGESNSGTSANGSVSESDLVVATFDDLPVCSDKREGATAYVKDEKTAYICEDGKWISDDETDVSSSSVKPGSSSSSVKPGSSSSKKDDPMSSSSVVSSSSEKSSSSVNSSSSIESISSSSVTLSEVEGSSSSSVIPGSDPESSSSDGNDDGKSSSSSTAKSSSSVESSSSVIPGSDPESSSSDGNDDGKSSSSSTAKSSSSVESSSSVIPGSDPESSSSDGNDDGKSSSSSKAKSSSSRGLFEMSKDEFLNPKISYGEMTDTRDNKTYKTVKIGDQVWMAENLNYADSTKMPSLKGKSWCFNNKAENCDVTGRLYTWAAAIDSVALANDADNPQTCGYGKTCTLPTVVQGVCPEGWHLPTYKEWQTLFTTVGGTSKAGTALKSQTGWKSQTGDAADRDAYGFSALPAGDRDGSGHFYDAGYDARFWSASQYEDSSYYAYYMRLRYSYEGVNLGYGNKNYGYSVRCLQNSN